MRTWSQRSNKVRAELDHRLITVVDRLLAECSDLSLISGHRGEAEQNALFHDRLSKLEYPHSKHNSYPSLAVDFRAYPWPKKEPKQWAALAYIAAHAILIGQEEGVNIRWGGDWNQNGDLTDQSFNDLFHLEIVECES